MSFTSRPSLRNYLATVDEVGRLVPVFEAVRNNSAAVKYVEVAGRLSEAANKVADEFSSIADRPEMSSARLAWDEAQVNTLLPLFRELNTQLQNLSDEKYVVGSGADSLTALALKNGLNAMLSAESRFSTRDSGAVRYDPMMRTSFAKRITQEAQSSERSTVLAL